MEIKRLFYAVWRKIWLVLALAIVFGTVAGFISLRQVPLFSAQTTLYAMNRDKSLLSGEAISSEDINLSRKLAKDYSEIAKSSSVTSVILREFKRYNITENDLNNMLSVKTEEDSNILTIYALSPDPQLSAGVANSMARALSDKVRELTNSNSISVLEKAKVPLSPVKTNSSKNILLGIIAGLALGFGFIYVVELFDTTVRCAEDIKKGLNLNVIGIIPEHDIR